MLGFAETIPEMNAENYLPMPMVIKLYTLPMIIQLRKLYAGLSEVNHLSMPVIAIINHRLSWLTVEVIVLLSAQRNKSYIHAPHKNT